MLTAWKTMFVWLKRVLCFTLCSLGNGRQFEVRQRLQMGIRVQANGN
ncbi:MAG: hypothetical protein QJR01_08255 [Kyrpidia sp.]|nr:hypothetical protein [Kyrpidia sp.]